MTADQRGTAYYGMMTSTWDVIRRGQENWDDRFLYQELIRQYGEPVLDVGCATGRLLLSYLKDGIDVDGVDNSPQMLAICRQKAQKAGLHPTLFQQSMQHLDIPRTYKTIMVASSTLQLLTDPEDATAAMTQLSQHLDAGGALVMPFMTLWSEGDPTEVDWELTGEEVREEDGATVRRWTHFWYDTETQCEHVEFRYEVTLDGKTLEEEMQRFSPETRSYTQQQAIDLYEAAGLTDTKLLEGSPMEPVSAAATLFTIIGRKA